MNSTEDLPEHFVTIRLEYVNEGRTSWKRRGRCTCGWQCFSWDGLRPILTASEHVQTARQFTAIVDGLGVDHSRHAGPPDHG